MSEQMSQRYRENPFQTEQERIAEMSLRCDDISRLTVSPESNLPIIPYPGGRFNTIRLADICSETKSSFKIVRFEDYAYALYSSPDSDEPGKARLAIYPSPDESIIFFKSSTQYRTTSLHSPEAIARNKHGTRMFRLVHQLIQYGSENGWEDMTFSPEELGAAYILRRRILGVVTLRPNSEYL